jgi:hypothetical protein
MLPFGKLCQLRGSRAQVLSRWLAAFEQAGCEVTREGEERLSVLVPGWDAALLPSDAAAGVQRWFWDRMIVTVAQDGSARFRLVYFTPPQLLLHAAVTAIFALQAGTGQGWLREPGRFALFFALAQALPWVTTLAGFRLSLDSALRRAFERE